MSNTIILTLFNNFNIFYYILTRPAKFIGKNYITESFSHKLHKLKIYLD